MGIKKKIILSVSVFVAMLVALVTGIICIQKTDNSTPTTPALDKGNVQKPTTYTYQAGQIELVGTNQTTIDFNYMPSSMATENTATVKAYEYIFGRPSNVEQTMAVTLQSMQEIEGVDISYVYSSTPLTFDSTTTSQTKFEAQTIDTKDADIYIYVLVSPSDATLPLNFTTTISWNFGNAGTISYTVNGVTTTETIVKGQDLPEPATPTAPTGYNFDAWFLDENFTKLATFPRETQGEPLFARFHNFPLNSNSCMTYSNGSYSVTDDPGIADLVIPTIYDDGTNGEAPVTGIGNQAFISGGLTSVNLPSTITTIGESAFFGNTLTNVDVSSCVDLTTINANAFMRNYNLTSLDLSNCKNLTTISTYAFHECEGLLEIDLSNCLKLQTVGDSIFMGCTSLTTVLLPYSVTTIDDNAFMGCSSLTNISNLNNVTTIGDYAFSNCMFLKNIDLSKCANLTEIGNNAFSGCSSLISVIIPSTVNNIGEYAFSGCMELTSINLNSCDNLTQIKTYTFEGCAKLSNIILPKNIITIGTFAFSGTNLFNLDLSKYTNLTTIEFNAFYIPGLTNIDLSGTKIATIGDLGATGLQSIKLPQTLTTISDGAFTSYSSLKEIDLTDTSITTIPSGIFPTTLESIKFPLGLQNIGENAFKDFASLTSVDLSACTSLTNISTGAFHSCTQLTSVILPSSLTYIAGSAFHTCTNLINVDMSRCSQLTHTGGSVFNGCGLVSIDLSGTSLEYLNDYMFGS